MIVYHGLLVGPNGLHFHDQGTFGANSCVYVCLSTDTKPTTQPLSGNASLVYETDTDTWYQWSGSTWVEYTESGGASAWGDITGTLANQTDLQTALDGKSATGHNHDANYEAIG